MRILFLAHLFPLPLDSGGKIKSYYTLRALAAAHEVRALAYVRSDEEVRLIPDLASICAGVETVRLERGRSRQVQDLIGSLARGEIVHHHPGLPRRDGRGCSAGGGGVQA